jgi:hypothetical protein
MVSKKILIIAVFIFVGIFLLIKTTSACYWRLFEDWRGFRTSDCSGTRYELYSLEAGLFTDCTDISCLPPTRSMK